MAFPTPTGIQTYHTTTYPTISPLRPALSTAHKTVLITGGGSGLGLAYAKSFASSGCTRLAITGRRSSTLLSAAAEIELEYPHTKVLTLPSDVTDREGVIAAFKTAAETFGKIDVLINNAGYLPSFFPLGTESASEADDWWSAFSVNVRGSHNVLSAFLPVAAENATVIQLGSGATNVNIPGQSAYNASKVAATRVFECFQSENPGFRVVVVAPGVVETGGMHGKTKEHFEEKGYPELPTDDGAYFSILARVYW